MIPSLKLSVAFFLCLAAALPALAAPQYTLQNIGTLTPNGSASAQGINSSGEVFGSATPLSAYIVPDHIFFWSAQGGIVDIGDLPYLNAPANNQYQAPMTAVAMNDAGQITGEAQIGVTSAAFAQTISHAFVWAPAPNLLSGSILDLGTLGLSGDAESSTSAIAINKRGQIIGLENPDTTNPEGFLWTPGGKDGTASNPQMKDLGQFQPSLLDNTGHIIGLLNGAVTLYNGESFVSVGDPGGFDVNAPYGTYRLRLLRTDAQGDIYGNYSSPTQSINPFVWVPDFLGATTGHFVGGIHSDMPILPPGIPTVAQLPADVQVFWSDENVFAFDPQKVSISAVDLGGLLFDTIRYGNPYFFPFDSYIVGQNAVGDLVGSSGYLDHSLGFVEQAGLMYDLNRHIQGPNAGVYQLLYANGINDNGQIAVVTQLAAKPYQSHSAVLTPAGQAAPPPPTITLIQPQSPDAGDPDQNVDVQGTGFQVGAILTYDKTPLSATIYAETQALALIPAADLTAGTHTVTITNPDGTAGSGSYVVLPVRPIPDLVSVSPATLPAGSPDTAITFTGTGLYPETQVGYGYSPLNDTLLTVLSASADHTQMTVLLPASVMVQGEKLTFYASTPGQRGTPGGYHPPILTVLNPVPTITSISPASLPADTVASFTLTVTGTNFVPDTQISWNGEYFPTTYVSATQVTAQIYNYNLNYSGPDAIPPGTVPVQVINAAPGGGTASTTQIFTDGPYPAPILTSVDPKVIPVGTGSYVFLNGSHFLHHSGVHIGKQTFSVTTSGNGISADRTQITIYLPASAVPPAGVYPVTVVNPGPGGGTTTVQHLTVQGASVFVTGAVLSRDPVTQQVVAQVTLTAGPGADAQGVTVNQAALSLAPGSALPLAAGTIPAGTATTITLRFQASAAASGRANVLRLSGKYTGGSFVSSRRVTLP